MAEQNVYAGGCHCGAVRFTATMALESKTECNCSICTKRGALWSFIGGAQFSLLSGEDQLTDYQFNKKQIHHLFCKLCGVGSFSRGAMPNGDPVVALNLRCLDDVDLSELPVRAFDGKNM